MIGRWKGIRGTGKLQSSHVNFYLGKLKIKKREEEKEDKKTTKKQKNAHTKKRLKFIIIVKWNKINDRMIEIK